MTRNRLEMKLDPEEDKLLLPSSSEDEEESGSNDEDSAVEDPFGNEESDSDDTPETVSFKSALEDSKALKRHASQVIRTQLDDRRRKRKEMHEQYLKDKEQKKQKIESKKLPDDFLDNLDDDFPSGNTDPIAAENNSDEEKFENEEKVKPSIPSEDIVEVHGPTMFKCKILPVEAKKPKYVPECVANFKDRLLYGGRIRRERSARDAVLKREKQFVKSAC